MNGDDICAMRPIPEDRRACASLVVLADIAAEDDALFNEWYNREHMRDRVLALPGFVRGRRYIAADADSRYLALYDVADAAVFLSQDYISLVIRPDPRSEYFIARFQNACRTIAQIDFAYGEGEGGAVALWPLETSSAAFELPALKDAVRQALVLPGTVAARVLSKDENMLAASSRQHVRQGDRTMERVLILETMDLPTARRAADVLTGMLGGAAPQPALFQLLYRVSP